ncbi:MAG TPA: hypothetical protein VFF04_04995 [Candidatus Babeliales bacterium]|nr:hypothetical protein [Candidatus Babeliales bacterium]
MKKMLYAVAVRSAVLGLSINMVSFAEEVKKQEPSKHTKTWREWVEKKRQWAIENKGTIAFGVGCLALGMIIANQKNSITIPVQQIPPEPKSLSNGLINGQNALRGRVGSADSGSPRNGLHSPNADKQIHALGLTIMPNPHGGQEVRVDRTKRFVGKPHERRTAEWAFNGKTLKDDALRDLATQEPSLPSIAWAVAAANSGNFCLIDTLMQAEQIPPKYIPGLERYIQRQKVKYEAKGIEWTKRIHDMPTKLERCLTALTSSTKPLEVVVEHQVVVD